MVFSHGFHHHRYEIKHAHTSNEQGMKNYYLLLQTASTIIQLLEKGRLLRKAFPKGLGSAKKPRMAASRSVAQPARIPRGLPHSM